MALIPKFFSDSVVALGQREENEKISWIATGFVVAMRNLDQSYNLFLVTNRHVFVDKKSIVARFNISGKLEAWDYDLPLANESGNKFYSVHPNPNVDIACIMLNPHILEADIGDISAFRLDENALDRNAMIENEVTEGTMVYSLGFPAGIVGLHTKSPLCRMGCICLLAERVNDEGFLIDIQNFPGSSGSPIINKLEESHLEGSKNYGKTSLIGIIASYIPYRDKLVSKQTGEVMQITTENSGIAIAYTVDAIKETVMAEYERVNNLGRESTDSNNAA